MKLTPVLCVRSWIAKLHPKVTTTPQENKQLLSLLSSSFRRTLDDAHPPILPTENRISGPAMDNASARAAIYHLQSVLHHPLLAQNSLQAIKAQSAAANAAVMMDQAMIDGRADLEVIEKCVRVYSQTLQNDNAAIKDEDRLGRKISAWFTSASKATKQRFLCSPAILRQAVPIMYADGLEATVWEWLGMLYSRTVHSSHPQQQSHGQNGTKPLQWFVQESHLTFLMIKETLHRSRLDAAVVQFIQTCAYMQSTERMSSEARSSHPWQATVKAITMALLRRRHQHGLPAHLFDGLLEHRSSWSDPATLIFELISLYHPTSPSAKDLAITVGQRDDQAKAHLDEMKAMSQPAQKIMLNALLDGAQLLLEQDSTSVREARLILDLVEKQFPTLAFNPSNAATQKRIQSVRESIPPPEFVPALVGIT
jgi:hypothetical protein